MSKIAKRALPILILTILALSFIPVSVFAIDFDTPATDPDHTYKGETVKVYVKDVTAGYDVELYWDKVKAWDGEAGLLNSTEAGSDGTAEIWFDVPEAVEGTHHLWILDTKTDETTSTTFTVDTYVKVSSSSGLEGDKVTVSGYGFGGEKDVAIILSSTAAIPDGTDVSGETVDQGDGSTKTFSFTLSNVPLEPGSTVLSITDGVETFTDDGDGTLTGDAGGSGTINYVTGEVEITFNAAPANGQDIDADYEYYKDTADTIYVFTTAVDSDSLGSFSKVVTIPDDTDMDYGNYYVYAFDSKGNDDDVAFTIGAVISLDIDEGPVGTVVEVRGRGFDPAEDIDAGEIVITDGVTPIACYIIDEPIDVDTDGDFKCDIVIPQVSDLDDYDTITVTPGITTATSTDFTVTGLAKIEVDPEYGVQGATATVHGYNFTTISGEDVSLELWKSDLSAKVADIDTFETDSNGEFSGTFSIPAVASDTYAIVADQADYNIDDDTEFRVGLMIVILSPSEGPTGTKVTLTGTGFTADGEWNATFGEEAIFEDMTVDSDGTISETFYVPTLDVGTYTVTVLDVDADIAVTTEFEVTYTTTVATDPVEAPNGYNVTIQGWYFTAEDLTSLEFVLYNATDDWDMTVKQFKSGSVKERDAVTNEDGNFTAWWEVPTSDTLSLGDYMINVTDGNDLFAQVAFKVVSKKVAIEPRKAEFAIGDTISFDIESSFKQEDSYIKIWDPDGNLYWKTDKFETADWIKVETLQTVPYYSQTSGGNPMILISDAPLGTWTWTWYDVDGDELDSGTFTVVAAPESVLAEQVADLETAVSSLSDDVSSLAEDVAGVKTDVAAAKAAADAAKAAASSAADAVSDIAETANSAKTAADNAASAASEAKSAAEEAKSAASGLTTLVYGAIGASLVAALAAIVSLMQISRRIAG